MGTAIAGLGRDHEGVIEGIGCVAGACEPQKLISRQQIDLVEDQKFATALDPRLLQRGKERLIVSVETLASIDQQRSHVSVARPAPGGIDHRPVQPLLGLKDAGRVDKNDLRILRKRDAAHQRTRCLHLARDDRHLGADKLVQQCRFAGVGRADQRHKAAARRFIAGCGVIAHAPAPIIVSHRPSRRRNASAAACSAPRLAWPSPLAGVWPFTVTVMMKRGAWSGPLRPVSA